MTYLFSNKISTTTRLLLMCDDKRFINVRHFTLLLKIWCSTSEIPISKTNISHCIFRNGISFVTADSTHFLAKLLVTLLIMKVPAFTKPHYRKQHEVFFSFSFFFFKDLSLRGNIVTTAYLMTHLDFTF